MQGPRRTVIAVGTLIDGRGAITRDTRIVVQDGRIAAIDATASPVDYDLGRATLMPGWIDTHVHINWHFDANGKSVSGGEPPADAALATAADAWVTLQGGFTTVQSLGAAIDGQVAITSTAGCCPGRASSPRCGRFRIAAAIRRRCAPWSGRPRRKAPT